MAMIEIATQQGEVAEEEVVPPKKSKKNKVLDEHGQTGWLVVQLHRYSLLGWFLFFGTFLSLLGGIFLYIVLPKPVAVVNEAGIYLGDINFSDEMTRSDTELIVGGINFISAYLSMNSETILRDYTMTLNTMTKTLQEASLKAEKKDGYIKKVESARSRSSIVFDEEEHPPEIIERKGLQAVTRYRGMLTVYSAAGGAGINKPFDITLFMNLVPRTTLTTQGFKIAAINDN